MFGKGAKLAAWHFRTTTKKTKTTTTTETSRDDEHGKEVVALSMFKTLCPPGDEARPAGSLLSSSSDGSPKAPIIEDDRGEGTRGRSIKDETTTDGARMTATTGRGIRW